MLFENFHNQTRSPEHVLTFDHTAFSHFQSLSIMCRLARQAVVDDRDLFLSTSVVTSQMPDADLFHLNTNSTFRDFQSSLSDSFIHNLQMFRRLSQGSGLVSLYSTNWHLRSPSNFFNAHRLRPISTKSTTYGGCDCAISSSCIQNSIPVVAGYVVGCLQIESFLRSTLECLYSHSCLHQISSEIVSSFVPPPLNQTESRFPMNIPNDDIVQEMFIESWSKDVSYEKFFEKCQPRLCSYTVAERYNPIYVVTTFLGLCGGIDVSLRLLVPFVMHQTYKCMKRFRRSNRQVMPQN